jgi:hypothetical protein
MSMLRYRCLSALAGGVLLIAAAPGVAGAQDETGKTPTKAERQTAREAYDKGTKAFEKGDYATALDSFVAANALIPSVQAMYWIAQAQDKLGRSEAAIEAYEAITSRGDFSKLSADKSTMVRERLAALKAAAAPPAPAAPLEPAPAEPAPAEPEPMVPLPPPTLVSPPPPVHDDDDDFLPQKNTVELGVMGGVLFVSPSHNLVEGNASQQEFDIPTGQIGARAAFFPEKVFGIEAEWAHGFGSVKDGNNASFDALRGHLIGQLPSSRFVPFALLGAGILRSSSGEPKLSDPSDSSSPTIDGMGIDSDFMLEAGIGFKVMATKIVVPRLDIRLGMTQAEGGGFADGVALHPEILLGLSFVLGR